MRALTHMAPSLKSALVSAKATTRYLLTKENLKKYLKLITPKDHQWHLRSLNRNMVCIVNVNFRSVVKSFGSTTRDHFKDKIHTLFAIFYCF